MEPTWLTLARELQAIAQTGLAFSDDSFDHERYQRVRAIAGRLIAEGAGVESERVLDLFAQDTGYATPRVALRAALFRDGGILCVKEKSDGLWSLPGGWADVNDSPSDCVVREIKEESGFDARVVKLAAVYDTNRHRYQPPKLYQIYVLFFLCEITGGAAAPGLETDAVGFFAADALPPLSTVRILAPQIRRMFEHHRNPDLPTDFD